MEPSDRTHKPRKSRSSKKRNEEDEEGERRSFMKLNELSKSGIDVKAVVEFTAHCMAAINEENTSTLKSLL